MRPYTPELAGRLEHRLLESRALSGNPLGDPATRPLVVYLPPGYDDSDRRYPVVYVLHGFASTVSRWAQRSGFVPSYPERADELFASSAAPPAILAFVDGWTRFGGSQYVDSPGTGNYRRYLCEDVVALLDASYRTIAGRAGRALQGHSSGGFGAVVTALARPELFCAFAAHAPDCYFEISTLPDVAAAFRALRDRYGGSYDRFFADHAARPPLSRPDDLTLLMVYAMATCYSAGADGSVELPFDTASGALREEVWERWLAFDPVRLLRGGGRAAAGSLSAWLDAGRSDEYRLDVGASLLADRLREAGVGELAFELIEGRHSGIDFRYPLALAWLCERLASS